MKIQAVSAPLFSVNNRLSVNKEQNFSTTPADSINFKGGLSADKFDKALKKATSTTFLSDSDAGDVFRMLLNNIKTDKNITTTREFIAIDNIYTKDGFWELMRSLWKPSGFGAAGVLSKNSVNNSIVLAHKDGNPVFTIFNAGPAGFWDALTGAENVVNKVELSFISPNSKNLLSFSLNKKSELALHQLTQGRSTDTQYHLSTGRRKVQVVQQEGGTPTKIYFNKDGSINTLKTWFLGGSADTAY